MGRRGIALLLALAGLPGCATTGGPPEAGDGGGAVRTGEFPSEEALEGLRREPGPAAIFGPGLRDVETWTLQGPFPDRVAVEAWSDDSAAGRVLARLAAARPGLVVPTRSMHCVARELGLFFLEHGARPPEGLSRAVRGACRAAVAGVSLGWVEGGAPERASDEELLEAWGETVEQTIRAQLAGGPRTAGIWLGRDGKRVLLMVAAGERKLHLEPIPGLTSDGTLVLEGETLVPAGELRAAVTRGRFGFAYCRSDDLPPPRFRFRCPVDPGDARAWLSVSLHPPGRVIGQLGAELLLWPRGPLDPVYRRPSYAIARQAWDEETTAAGFAALLNEIRQGEGLAPLVVDPEQSAVARERAARGRAAPDRLHELDELSAELAGAVQAGVEPREALHELLSSSGESLGRSLRGWSLESSELEEIEFPAELLDAKRISVSIGVASYRPAGEAWGRYVVMIVSADPGRGI